MRHVVNGLLIKGQRVMLARRSKTRRQYPNRWSFPGGHVETGESLEQALTRELQEEIGVTPTEFQPRTTIVTTDSGAGDATFHIFTITNWIGDPRILDREHSQLRWMTLSDAEALPDLALPHYVHLLQSLALGSSPHVSKSPIDLSSP